MIATVQLQSVPGEPRPPSDPADYAASKLAEQGIVLVSGSLDLDAASRIVAQLLAADSERRLTLHLTNVSGNVAAALMIHDVVTASGAGVTVVAGGTLDTAGAIVLVAGRPGERTLLPSARIHLTRIEQPATEGLPLEQAAAEVEHLRHDAEAVLGVSLDRPRMLDAAAAIAEGLADKVR